MLRVSSDGTRVVNLVSTGPAGCPTACSTLVVYDLATHIYVAPPIDVPFFATDVAINHDGTLVSATGTSGEGWHVATWEVASGRRLARARFAASTVAFGAGDVAYLGSESGRIREVAARTLDVRRVLTAPHGFSDDTLLVSDGRLLAAGSSGQAAFDLRERPAPVADRCTPGGGEPRVLVGRSVQRPGPHLLRLRRRPGRGA